MYISNVNSASIKLLDIYDGIIFIDAPKSMQSDESLNLLYVVKGAGHCTYQGAEYEVKKRDVLILNPDQSITIKPLRKIEYVCITLSGVVFTSSSELNSAHQLFIVSDQTPAFKQYLDLAMVEHEARFRGSDLILRKILECILIHLLRHNGLSIKDATSQVKHSEIELVKAYIREHYAEKISLEELAELVDINKYYLIRLFKQQTGLSPIDYLIHVRLEEAEKLLAQSTVNISEISDLVGFHSPSHFSKTFKESNHCTPSVYRKRYMGNL